MNDFVIWAFSTGLSVFGLCGSICYLWLSRPSRLGSRPRRVIGGDRPWRRLGAAICALVSLMFYAGIHVLDGSRFPRTFAAYWMVILVLIVWLCGLALRDMLYTRRVIREQLSRNDRTA